MTPPPGTDRKLRHLAWRLLVAAGVTLAVPATADPTDTAGTTAADPFGTLTMAPARPGAQGIRPDTGPCRMEMSGEPLNLAAVVDLALCRNPLTRETWATARIRAAEIGLARAAYLPVVAASATADISRTRTAGTTFNGDQRSAAVSLAWLLADFGARDAGLESARQLLVAATATQDSRIQALFFAALQAYYEVHARRAAVLAAQESERAALEGLRAAETRYAVGTGTPADRLQAQTAHSQAVFDRVRAEGDLRIADGNLANVMGYDARQPVALGAIQPPTVDEPYAQDIGALITEAARQRPELLAAEAELKAARAGVEAARAADRPTISLAASAGARSSDLAGSARSGTIGLSLNVPLFTGHDTLYRVRAAEARADLSAALHDQLRLQVSLDVWQSYQALQTAVEAIRTSLAVLENAAASERVALGRYRAGVGNVIDLLNAQAAHARARQQHVQANLDWNLARAALAQAMGRLDEALLVAISDEHARSPAPPPAPLPARPPDQGSPP